MASALVVLLIVALAGVGIALISARQWRWQETFRACGNFATVAGLNRGDRVRVQGIDAGVVDAIEPPTLPGGPVKAWFRLDARLKTLVRADATARIGSQGLVGPKVVEIIPGKPDAPPLGPSGQLATEPPVEMSGLLADLKGSLRRLDVVADEAEQTLSAVRLIASSIARGEGSVGKLVRDDEAYKKLVAVSSRGERAMGDLEENLAALKRTWPLSRYFNDRAFFDRDRLLYQPGAERDSRSLPADDLFESGRAVLTARGRALLDETAGWSKAMFRPGSEVVIAAFTDDAHDAGMAEILTQEQADSVRKYLNTKHALETIGWFRTRKVAAVGFGTQSPRVAAGLPQPGPPRRVEIIVFTPQA
ncbi:MlaD family protein [Isosphaeraceae bacterium EP7]